MEAFVEYLLIRLKNKDVINENLNKQHCAHFLKAFSVAFFTEWVRIFIINT